MSDLALTGLNQEAKRIQEQMITSEIDATALSIRVTLVTNGILATITFM
jgi:hypothetical protein